MSELAVAEEKNIQAINVHSPDNLLAIAVERGTDIDQLTKLMDLKDRYDAAEAKKDFDSAISGFQSELGTIIKGRDGHNCKYADIDDIAKSIRPLLAKHKMSYRFEQSQNGDQITVKCVVSHTSGHSVSCEFSAKSDKSGGKNDIQSLASAVTYLRRYTLTGALGITTGEDDNDGGRPSLTVDELLAYNNIVRDEFLSIAAIKEALVEGHYATAIEAWHEIDQNTQRELWKAPTKGGVFTTDERAKMKSNEWAQAAKDYLGS